MRMNYLQEMDSGVQAVQHFKHPAGRSRLVFSQLTLNLYHGRMYLLPGTLGRVGRVDGWPAGGCQQPALPSCPIFFQPGGRLAGSPIFKLNTSK